MDKDSDFTAREPRPVEAKLVGVQKNFTHSVSFLADRLLELRNTRFFHSQSRSNSVFQTKNYLQRDFSAEFSDCRKVEQRVGSFTNELAHCQRFDPVPWDRIDAVKSAS